MLTPNEVSSQRFDKAVFGGYSIQQIDDFFTRLTEDYAALYKDNALLKSKLKTLATTVEEYRSVDDGMRKALLNTQKMAESMLEEARAEAKRIVDEAANQAAAQTASMEERIKREETRLQKIKKDTVLFTNAIRELYQRQLQLLDAVPTQVDTEQPMPREQTEARLKEAAAEIEQNIANRLAEPEVKDTMSFGFVQGDGHPVSEDTAVMLTIPEISVAQAVEEKPKEAEAAVEAKADNADPVNPVVEVEVGAPNADMPKVEAAEPNKETAQEAIQETVGFEPEEKAEALDGEVSELFSRAKDIGTPAADFEAAKSNALQDTLTRLREMDKALSEAERKDGNAVDTVLQRLLRGGDKAMEDGEEDTAAKLPKIDYDNLSFGKNYDPNAKK